ncbi:MAG: hypothetical protein J0I16_15390 [Rhizobiales bacterium]|nr:hypothetical protein [Hyphomicrobiales bacterium]
MFVAFHQLPLTVMFFVVLAISIIICGILIALVRFLIPRLGYDIGEPLPIRDSLINACGGLFALIVAFSAAGIWNDALSARNACNARRTQSRTQWFFWSASPMMCSRSSKATCKPI